MSRACIVFESSLTTADLTAAVTDRELAGRALTSTCRLYASGSQVMLTGPQSYALPRTWAPGDVRSITLADSDVEAVAMTDYEWLLAHEVTS